MPDILSVGIDIGTSTTQVIFSRLMMENTSGYFSVPHVSIVDKEVVYKSEVYLTPLKTNVLIDTDKVRDIVSEEFRKAGFTPKDTKSGAVIITGESARKENSDAVLAKLSDFAGDFVVSAAGPDMESVIAGKGSGAFEYSMNEHCTVVNLDIGGGTTNIAVFDDGEVIARGCLDIGGRLICVDRQMHVTKLSPAARAVSEDAGIDIRENEKVSAYDLKKITDRMADLIFDFLKGKKSRILSQIKTPGSSDFEVGKAIDCICFSGGVADGIYHEKSDLFQFDDIGIMLGKSIRTSGLLTAYQLIRAGETIRATVVGAGTYTTTISGSTITYTKDIFPLKNIPVLKLNASEQSACFLGHQKEVSDRVRWFMAQSDAPLIILAMDGIKNPSYAQVRIAAGCIGQVMDECLEKKQPVIVVIKNDIAKAIGQLIYQYLKGRRQVVAIDSIAVDEGDYVDMGKPVMNGMVVPVVVKTLVFG